MMSGHKRLDSTIKGRKRRVANTEFLGPTVEGGERRAPVQLDCPRCGRTPQLSERTLLNFAKQWHGDEIDVSMLPF